MYDDTITLYGYIGNSDETFHFISVSKQHATHAFNTTWVPDRSAFSPVVIEASCPPFVASALRKEGTSPVGAGGHRVIVLTIYYWKDHNNTTRAAVAIREQYPKTPFRMANLTIPFTRDAEKFITKLRLADAKFWIIGG